MRAVVRGRVQGVGYRAFVTREAERLGLGGWTRNLADGRVEVVAAGDPELLARLVERLGVGPPAACVEAVDRSEIEPPPHFEGFTIRF